MRVRAADPDAATIDAPRSSAGSTRIWRPSPLSSIDASDFPTDPFALSDFSKRSAVDYVFDKLVAAIAIGAFSPGDVLPPERELATQLGVSRATLRQAIGQLVGLGLLASRRGRTGGTFVTERSWQSVAPDAARRTLEYSLPRMVELFDYRCLVEGMIGRAAAQRRSAADCAELRSLVEEFVAAQDMSTARAIDRRLHARVAAAARNAYLVRLRMELTTAATLGFASAPYTREFFHRAAVEHRALVDAICRGDAERACSTATEHFRITELTLRSTLDRLRQGVPAGPEPLPVVQESRAPEPLPVVQDR